MYSIYFFLKILEMNRNKKIENGDDLFSLVTLRKVVITVIFTLVKNSFSFAYTVPQEG